MNPTVQASLAAGGSFLLITLVVAAIVGVCNMRRNRNRRRWSRKRSRKDDVSCSASFDPSLKSMSMSELSAATKNFSPELIIGDGSFGLVYKARLGGGAEVAVKRLDPDAFQGFREFRAEMETLGSLRHPNLVRILGYCASGEDRVLMYEYKERGSLDQWVHLQGEHQGGALPWSARVSIILGVAEGLSYLHSLDTPIIHRDIKASNVLLDSHFRPFIADFGLARRVDRSRSHVSTQAAGTMGYMPPEYKEGLTAATLKADVYSFGILMFELATARRPNLSVDHLPLLQWARNMLLHHRHMEMLDPSLQPLPHQLPVTHFFKIASLCTSDYPTERPIMTTVLPMLTHLLSL